MSLVTTESSQSAKSVNRPNLGSQQVRIAILVVVAAIVGLALWLTLFHNGKKHHNKSGSAKAVTVLFGPKALSQNELAVKALAHRIYWIGPKRGIHYEFERLSNSRLFVRYLPKSVKAGKKPGKYLIVATYPFPGAYAAIKKNAKHRGVTMHGALIIPARIGDKKSVLIAWPKVPFQVEVYDPVPGRAATIAESGKVKRIIG